MRFLLLLLLAAAALAGLYLVLLYGFLPYAVLGPALDAANAAAQLAAAPLPPQVLAHSPANYARLQAVGFALLAAGGLGLGTYHRALGRELRRLGHEARRAGRALRRAGRRQSRASWLGTGALLLTVAAVRLWYLLHNPFNPDEQVSADYFAAPGAAVTAGFYLLPNNHVLYNLLAGAVLRLAPAGHPELLMRLPSVVLGLAGLVVGFAGLAYVAGTRVAALATVVFQLSPMAVEYATVARGYGPQALCGQAAALATVVLLRGPAGHRLAWAVWVAASAAGFYCIPTFWYTFAGLGAALLLAGGRGSRRRRVQTLVAGLGVGALVGLLYLPIGWLSGWHLLLANSYVRPHDFWAVARLLPQHWRMTTGELYGTSALALPLLGLLALAPGAVARWGHPALRPLAWVAWAGVVAPWPLLLAQRVLPPARTLHGTAWLAGVLAAVVLASVVRRWPAPAAWGLAFVLGTAYAGARLTKRFAGWEAVQQQARDWQQAETWLAARPARPVLTTVPGYEVFLTHRAWVRGRPWPAVRFADHAPVAPTQAYLVLNAPAPTLAVPAGLTSYRAVLHNGSVWVYARYEPAPVRPASR